MGKIPGRYLDGDWCGLTGQWAGVGLDAATSVAAKEWPTQNVGIRAASFPAIDIDTSTDDALRLVEEIVQRVAPEAATAPVRFRDGSPRALYSFRLAPGSDPVRKGRVAWIDAEGKTHAVDVLGLGQQYVVSGTHPSGSPYEWRDGRNLDAVGASELPVLTRDALGAFLQALQEAIAAAGGTVIEASARRGAAGGNQIEFENADPVLENAMALEALNHIPNTEEHVPSRENLVALLASFKTATGRNAESLRFDVEEWATRHGWADAEYFEQIWDSIRHSCLEADYLIGQARKHGWRGDAVLDFAGFDPAETEREIERIIKRYMNGELLAPEKAPGDLATVAGILRTGAPGSLAFDEMRQEVILMRSPNPGEAPFRSRPIRPEDYLIIQEKLQIRRAPPRRQRNCL